MLMLDLVVPVFNRPDYTEACLNRLSSVDHGCPIRPIIIDNGSRAATKSIIKTFTEGWKFNSSAATRADIITSSQNLGFAGAIKLFLSKKDVCSDTVVIMHNDVMVMEGWAIKLAEAHESLAVSDELAAIMPRTCYANENSVCSDIRKTFQPLKPPNKDRMMLSEIEAVIQKTYEGYGGEAAFLEKLRTNPIAYSYCPEVASFCMMVDRNTLGEGFDTDFFPRGYEDKFWFLKRERQGLCCHIAEHSYVHHFGNITSDGPGFFYPDVMKVNETRFKEKVSKLDQENPNRL